MLWPVGVQPMNWERFVESENTTFTAFSTAVLYCSAPWSDVTTTAAPTVAMFESQLSVSSVLMSTV